MAGVYQAHDLPHGRDVAIRVMHPGLAESGGVVTGGSLRARLERDRERRLPSGTAGRARAWSPQRFRSTPPSTIVSR